MWRSLCRRRRGYNPGMGYVGCSHDPTHERNRKGQRNDHTSRQPRDPKTATVSCGHIPSTVPPPHVSWGKTKENWGKNRSDAAARDRWHGLPMTVRRAADALEYPHIHPTTPPDLQKSSWLTMIRRWLRVSQESPESQGHHAHEENATRGCWSISKVPPATLSTGTPRQLALRSRIPSLLLVIDCVICRVS